MLKQFKQYLVENQQLTPEEAYEKAEKLGDRIPELEPIILTDLDCSIDYARYIIRKRWPEAEPIISTDARCSYLYAYYVIEDRWPEAEQTILSNPKYAYFYAADVLQARWPEAEPIILTDPEYSKSYLRAIVVNHGLFENIVKYNPSLLTMFEDIPEDIQKLALEKDPMNIRYIRNPKVKGTMTNLKKSGFFNAETV